MEFVQLNTFITLARYENMSITAQELNTSQPQVSKILASLEAELGIRLFDRVGRGLQLNEHGKVFTKYAVDAITVMQNGRIAMQNLKNSILGTVTVNACAFSIILNGCIHAYQKQNPNVNFQYCSEDSGIIPEKNTDILLCPCQNGRYMNSKQFPVFMKLLEEEYYYVVPRSLRMFPEKTESLFLREISDLPFIIMGKADTASNSDYSVLLQISGTTQIMPHIAFAVNEFILKMTLLAQGAGIALLPAVCLEPARKLAPDIRFFRIRDIRLQRSVVMAARSREHRTPIAQSFWDFAESYYRQHPFHLTK